MLSVMELPATAIYFLDFRESVEGEWIRFGYVVVNGGEEYVTEEHTFHSGDESWWAIDDVSKVPELAHEIRLTIGAVAEQLEELEDLIADIEQETGVCFDTPYVLDDNSWEEVAAAVEGPVFAGLDTEGELLIRVKLDVADVLDDVLWYSATRLTGTPYFGGEPEEGKSVTLTRLSPEAPDWPREGDWVHSRSTG